MRTCDFPGCDRKHSAQGYCGRHYRRYLRGTLAPREQTERICGVAGCGRKHSAKGWCATHYRRQSETGDVWAHVPIVAANFGRRLSEAPVGFDLDDTGEL